MTAGLVSSAGRLALPEGRTGRLLALALALFCAGLAVLVLWSVLVGPLLGLAQTREAALARREMRLRAAQVQVAALPALRRALAARIPAAPEWLPGTSDALAAAALQSLVQAMARQVGARVASVAILPARTKNGLRRVGLRLALSAPFPALVALLVRLAAARPRLIVTALVLRAGAIAYRTAATLRPAAASSASLVAAPVLAARLTVAAFRAPGAPAR